MPGNIPLHQTNTNRQQTKHTIDYGNEEFTSRDTRSPRRTGNTRSGNRFQGCADLSDNIIRIPQFTACSRSFRPSRCRQHLWQTHQLYPGCVREENRSTRRWCGCARSGQRSRSGHLCPSECPQCRRPHRCCRQPLWRFIQSDHPHSRDSGNIQHHRDRQ